MESSAATLQNRRLRKVRGAGKISGGGSNYNPRPPEPLQALDWPGAPHIRVLCECVGVRTTPLLQWRVQAFAWAGRLTFSSHPTCVRRHRLPARTRATMFPDWGSPTRVRLARRPSKLPQTYFQRFFGAKSLFRNTLPISTLNSKTWRDFPPNPMIPIDREEGGTPY